MYSLLFILIAVFGLAASAFPEVSWGWWPFICGLALVICGWVSLEVRREFSSRALLLLGILSVGSLLPGRYDHLMRWTQSRWDQWTDRARLEGNLAHFPSRLWQGRPQRVFFEGKPPRSARWQGQTVQLPVVACGPTLFYIDLEPEIEQSTAVLDIDGSALSFEVIPAVTSPGPLVADSEQGLAAAVSTATDECIVIDRMGKVHTLSTNDGPSSCQVLPGGMIAVGHCYEPTVAIYQADNDKEKAVLQAPGLVSALALSPDKALLAALWENSKECGVVFYGTRDWTKAGECRLSSPGEYLCFGPDSRQLVVASRRSRSFVKVVNKGGWAATGDPVNLARPATGMVRSADGSKVYFTATAADLVPGDQGGNHYIRESLCTLDLKAWKVTHSLLLEDRTARQDSPGDIDSGCGACGLSLDSEGRVLMAFSGTHEIARINLPAGDSTRTNLAAGQLYCPNSFVELAPGLFLAAFPAQGELVFLKPTLKEKDWVVQARVWLGKTDEQLEKSDQLAWYRRQGQIGFFESARAGVSCQSCHTKADSDYAKHEIGSGIQFGTLSCLGVAGTGPYLRNGGYPSLADLHTTSVDVYRGFLREAAVPRAKALKVYLQSLELPANPRIFEEEDLEKLKRGYQVFQKAHCAECHAPPAFTNLGLVEGSTLFPSYPGPEALDVPSLRGVWRSAPYLHDNRADTLKAVLVRENPDNAHGSTKDLSEQELTDLIFFLESL